MGYIASGKENTIVLPLHPDKRERVFERDRCCHGVAISEQMLTKIQFMAVYWMAPTSAITDVVYVTAIERQDDGEYTIHVAVPPRKVGPIAWHSDGQVYPIRGPRYAMYDRLLTARTLDELWPEPAIASLAEVMQSAEKRDPSGNR